MYKQGTRVRIVGIGDLKNKPARIMGVVSDFSPMYVMYIVLCPGVLEYDCFPMHSAHLEEIDDDYCFKQSPD